MNKDDWHSWRVWAYLYVWAMVPAKPAFPRSSGMSKFTLKCSLAALALAFAGATLDVAEAGGTGRKQRGSSGQMMRLGGPTNGTAATVSQQDTNIGGTIYRNGDGLRTTREINRFFHDQRSNSGPG
jgi:hypothetical protein